MCRRPGILCAPAGAGRPYPAAGIIFPCFWNQQDRHDGQVVLRWNAPDSSPRRQIDIFVGFLHVRKAAALDKGVGGPAVMNRFVFAMGLLDANMVL